MIDGRLVCSRSAASIVGQVLAGTGLVLNGPDSRLPDENTLLPGDVRIRGLRMVGSISLDQKSLPFNTCTELSANLEIDQQALPGCGAGIDHCLDPDLL